jgi:cephalosporin hydroxylase
LITIDEKRGVVIAEGDGVRTEHALDTPEAFALVSDAWLRAGWWAKHTYTFSWMGRPVIQLPEDLVRLQELIWQLKPDVIVETGVAHGGGLVFYASLCEAMGRGRVVGIDVDIRAHNRTAIEAHPLFHRITLIEGSSVDPEVVGRVQASIEPGDRVLVLLDSNHTKAHVAAELRAYGPMVTPGSYIIAMDGYIMTLNAGAPRTSPDWAWDNPGSAAAEFVQQHPDFVLDEPVFSFNESPLSRGLS